MERLSSLTIWERNTSVLPISAALVGIFLLSRIGKFMSGLRAVSYIPGLRIPFQPLALPGALIPTSWWNPGLLFPWMWRYNFYKKYQNENVSVVPFIFGVPVIYTSNLDVARQVSAGGHKSSFIKPESASRVLLLWGMNLVAAEGEMWRKHRRIMGPAFSNRLQVLSSTIPVKFINDGIYRYELVWQQTLNTYREMLVGEQWDDKESVEVSSIQALTFKLALLVIGKCGFGFNFDWSAPPKGPDGSMSVQESLRIVADANLLSTVVPKWVLKLPFKPIQEVRQAHEQLAEFMQLQVMERKEEIKSQSGPERTDAFTLLVKANESESGKLRLDDQELIGNVFVMLFAGHGEAPLNLLEILSESDLCCEQILDVVGYDRDPVFDDYSSLNIILSIFYEALRMFPAGHVLIREATEDTVLTIPNPPGEDGSTTLPVPKGVQVVVDMIGVQYNPRYFDEPEKFKPSRWYDLRSDSEAFSALVLVRPRACIGRKFATTEAVCFLTMLLRDWREQWRDRVLDARVVITLGVADVPVKFTRRRRV
ncbi:cytochrome P450 [Infundibulicybe gibba]|nr:cytochrome P450 [Infundibulicybe gibba]